MNDVLPKPFTKENLLSMLEVRLQLPLSTSLASLQRDVLTCFLWFFAQKHLEHLKLVQQMAEIPRALGFTDHQIQDALAQAVVISDEDGSGSESGHSGGGNGSHLQGHGGVLNPFSSYGLSDQDYVGMLQGIAMEKEGKRELEVVHGDGTVRFQEGAFVLPWQRCLYPVDHRADVTLSRARSCSVDPVIHASRIRELHCFCRFVSLHAVGPSFAAVCEGGRVVVLVQGTR